MSTSFSFVEPFAEYLNYYIKQTKSVQFEIFLFGVVVERGVKNACYWSLLHYYKLTSSNNIFNELFAQKFKDSNSVDYA